MGVLQSGKTGVLRGSSASNGIRNRCSKTLCPEGYTAQFLFTMLKQVDTKAIDWQEVANATGLVKRHAARMRWYRFKIQMERQIESKNRLRDENESEREANEKPVVKRDSFGGDYQPAERLHKCQKKEEDTKSEIKLEGWPPIKQEYQQGRTSTLVKAEYDPRYKTTTPSANSDLYSPKSQGPQPFPTIIKIDDDDDDDNILQSDAAQVRSGISN